MSDTRPPRGVNWPAAAASVPVVTTLLAQLSTATFLVPLAITDSSHASILGRFHWNSLSLSVVSGVVATGSFIAASLILLEAQSNNFRALGRDQQLAVLKGWQADPEKLDSEIEWWAEQYDQRVRRLYDLAQAIWLAGLASFAVSVGSLTHPALPGLFYLLGATAIGIGSATFAASTYWLARSIGGLTVVLAGGIVAIVWLT